MWYQFYANIEEVPDISISTSLFGGILLPDLAAFYFLIWKISLVTI